MSKLYRLTLLVFLLSIVSLYGQKFSISGTVTDDLSGEPLVGANVYIPALNIGGVTNADGYYEIENVSKGTYELTCSFVGYITEKMNVNVNQIIIQDFALTPTPYLLGETVVEGTRATLRETPVAFTEVQGEEIEFKLASRDLPQVLNTVPNVYSSPAGGGAGDADLVVRGFSQRDVAIMINGVPVNDMENGWVYWSNWAGLGEVTSNIQVQRGLGASPYSVNAIGGVVNVQTYTVKSREPYSIIKSEFGSDGLRKSTVAFSTDLSSNVGLTALVSRKLWDGYAEGTPLDEFTYFFSVGGVFGNHSLEFTGVGSPQEHGQRLYRQSVETWHTRGFNYNPNLGVLHGRFVNERWNKYHKPQFNLNWNWQINDASLLSTVAYLSVGSGYGTGHIGSGVIYATNDSGYYDYTNVYNINTNNIDSTYSTSMNRSVSGLRESVNNHFWTGLLSTFENKFNDELTLNVGFDGRYYLGQHYRQMRDLLGGDYFVDTYNKNTGPRMVTIGDTVAYHNDGKVIQYGGFTQLEYAPGPISTFINVSVSQTGFQRIDYFNFLDSDPNQTTEWRNFLGYTVKAGINFNIDARNNIFFNGGYFEKPPIFDNVFDFANNYWGDVFGQEVQNEKILGIEAGYGFSSPVAAVRLNGFYTKWTDRSVAGSTTRNNIDYFFNLQNTNQVHIGAEFEARVKPSNDIELAGSFSWAENKYKNNPRVVLAPEDNPNNQSIAQAYLNDLYVGNFPMINGSVQFIYNKKVGSGMNFHFNPVFKYHGKYYASFGIDSRNDPAEAGIQSWKLPDFYLVDVHVGLDILFTDFFFKKMMLGFHVFNALDNFDYIVDAEDGRNHDEESALVFYGRKRWWNFSVGFAF